MVVMKKKLIKKMQHAFSEQWDTNFHTKYEIIEVNKKLGLELFKINLDGSCSLICSEPPIQLNNEKEVDDLIARSLSNFLKLHPKWRKNNIK